MIVKNKKLSLSEQAAQLLSGEKNEQVVTGGGATGQAIGPKPVAAQGGDSHKNRPQDKKGADSMVKPQNPAGTPVQATDTENNVSPTGDNSASNRASVAMKPVREDIDAIFAGTEVSEEFKTKAETIFEAAVAARVAALSEDLETNQESQLEEAVALIQEQLEGKIDEYLNYVVEQWMEANAIAIESGLRADIAENFMKGLHALYLEHHIEVPEDKVDVVEELAQELEETKAALNDAVTQAVELKSQLDSAARAKIVDSVTEGLVETQKVKLSTLFETVEFTTAEEFKSKLSTIKDGYLTQGTPADKKTGIQNLLEQVEDAPAGDKKAAVVSDPSVKSYVDALTRTVKQR